MAGGASNLLNEPCSWLISKEATIEELCAKGKDNVQSTESLGRSGLNHGRTWKLAHKAGPLNDKEEIL